jgi:hypothetical protein
VSDPGEETDTNASMPESNDHTPHEPDYVNKHGVRFTPDQLGKEGELLLLL